MVWVIIAANAAVFLYQQSLSGRELEGLLYQHALVPARYFVPGWGRQEGLSPANLTPFITNTFLHGGWLHVILNMWTFFIFGPALEDRLGTVRFLALYLIAGIAASVAHALFNATSEVPMLGASGAIAGIIGAYALRFPHAWVRVLVLIVIFPLIFSIPAMLFAAIWFAIQLFQGTSELLSPYENVAGVAWWAHVGGFVAGLVLLPLMEPSGSRKSWYNGGPWEKG